MILHFHRFSRRILWFFAFFLFLVGTPKITQAEWGTPTITRHRISLCGTWQVRAKGQKVWTQTQVPGEVPPGKIYFFEKSFVLKPAETTRVFRLFVEGINFRAAIKINEQYVGDVPAGFEPIIFSVDPGVLRSGKNVLSIEVNTRQQFDSSLPPKGELLEPIQPAGIFRKIFLLSLPSCFVNAVQVQTDWTPAGATFRLRAGAATVDSVTMTYVPLPNGRLQVQLFSSKGGAIASWHLTPTKGTFSGQFSVSGAKAWSPEHPALYHLVVTLQDGAGRSLDVWQTHIGFRRLRQGNGHFFLNGTRIQFRGLSLLTQSLTRTPNSLGEEVKRLGGNALHFAYTPPPEFFDLADSLGLFVFAGLPLWNPVGRVWTNDVFAETARQFQAQFVRNFASHPSFASFVWGNGLEAENKAFISFVKRTSGQPGFQSFPMGATFRTVSFKKEPWPLDWLGLDLTSFKNPDWKSAVVQARKFHPERPVLLTQISVPLIRLFNRPEDKLIFEQRQANYLAKILRPALKSPLVDGCFVLADRDFIGTYPTLFSVNGTQVKQFPLGLSEAQTGQPRVAWKVVRDLFHGQKTATTELAESRDPRDISFILWGFAVIIFFLYFLRGNRRVSGNFARIFSRPHGFYQELESERRIALGHSLIINFSASATLAILTAGVAFFYRESFLFDFLATKVLFFSAAKRLLVPLVWTPAVFVPVLTIFAFLLFSALALLIQMTTFVVGRPLSLRNSLTLVYWLSGIFIFLAPLAMIVPRVWHWPVFAWGIVILVLVLVFWFVYRILLGMKIILHYSIGSTALFLLFFAGLFLGVLTWIYESHVFLLPYLSYIIHVARWGI